MSGKPIVPEIRFVLATMFLNAMGFGIVVPSTPQLVMELGGATLSEATAIGGLLAVVYAVFQFIFGPIVGNLSDRYGRRPVLLVSLAGFAIDFLAMAFAPTLAWLFAARMLNGIFGATNAPAQAAIADLATPDERARLYGYISAAFGAGFVAGPAIGGLLGEIGLRLPFYAAAALALANFLYGLVAFPETLDPANRRRFAWRRANPLGSLLFVGRMPGMAMIGAVYLLWQLASLIYPMTWAYYAIGRFGWSNGLVGLSLAVVGGTMVLTQILVAPRVVARIGERRTAAVGMAGGLAGMIAFALVTNGTLAMALLLLVAFQSLVHPCLTAMLSRRADATNQGEVQGYGAALMAVGSIIAPLVFNPVLAWFTGPSAPFVFYGAAFVVAAAETAVAMLLLARLAPAPRPDPAFG